MNRDLEIDRYLLAGLPSFVRWFVGIVTTLMLLVTVWVMLIYTAEKGGVDQSNLPSYLSDQQQERLKRSVTPDVKNDSMINLEMKQSRIYGESGKSRWRQNLGMAHTHINGQTLLFFVLGTLFMFTSVAAKRKKIICMVFGLSIVVHAIGLSGEGIYPFFDDILALSGLSMLLAMLYMSFMIYTDLARKRTNAN